MTSLLEENVLFRGVYCWLAANEDNAEHCTPEGQALRDGLLPAGWEWGCIPGSGIRCSLAGGQRVHGAGHAVHLC